MGARTLSILVVDDDRPVLQSVAAVVEEEGHACFRAASEEEAFQIAARHLIEATILDLEIGSALGLELLMRLRTYHAEVSALLMTGALTEEVRRRAQRLGVRGILQKPLDLGDLRQALRGLA